MATQSLTGRTILVTGGGGGIGLAFAKTFAQRGNTVIITGRNEDKLKAAADAVPGLKTIRCDAASIDDLDAMAKQVDAEFPSLDLLFNNAGIFEYRNLKTRPADLGHFTREIDINLIGAIRTIAVLVDRLRANKGTIVNVTSGLAFVPLQAAPIYCATKAALHSYTIALRQQLQDQVHVVELMPPAVRTDLTADLPEDGGFKIITTDALVKATMGKLAKGAVEIRPGQANQLHWMSRMAPGFIQKQLAKGSAALVPS